MESAIQRVTLPDLQADKIQCALQDRILNMGAKPSTTSYRRVVLLTSGTGEIITDEEILPLKAPCLAWIPWRPDRLLRIKAGGVGFQLSVGDSSMAEAIGINPESANLRQLTDRRVIISLEDDTDTLNDAHHAFTVIIRELFRPNSGSWTLMLAQVQSLLVHLWRGAGVESVAAQSHGEASRILQHFRQLLEMHFRDRWTVKSYANAIGVSHDRLHDTCRRKLSKTPQQLVQERVLHEAQLRLEKSLLTVEQIANSLGFKDVSHFSRFFKAKMGLPPATYRDKIYIAATEKTNIPVSNYADWP